MAFSISLEQELAQWNEIIRNYLTEPKAYIRRGMINFKLANILESIQDFDQAEKLDSTVSPYLWQRGLSYYYAKKFEEGAAQFELDLSVNAQDVEETVWRYLCIAQLNGTTEARQALLAVKNDPRPIMNRVYELYAGNCTPEDVLAAGKQDGRRGRFYSYLYTGLYYEAAGSSEQSAVSSNTSRSRFYISKAANECKLDDYMWYLACVHQTLRGWN